MPTPSNKRRHAREAAVFGGGCPKKQSKIEGSGVDIHELENEL
jgi:hypothetical protein